ncbi:LOW QUALITY PROTEIN: ras-related protein rab7 [Colossoma macropomum]|uniref:LOW QUALITY PROTEIN: ras-related protein rab7 n=1 Tax=Colossoma macropomum TaxID=42526 RepID=UPI001863BC88|nr:LOW QUALITY PROTEIN: ras-related protein rab7 [Colossoma macropomum]
MDKWSTPHLKVVLVGNSGVGKSSMMTRFVDHRFTNMYRATIGVDFLTKEVTEDKNTVILQVWDTAGSERFHSLGSTLYRGAHCCLLVFDLSSAASFSALDGWHTEFLLQAAPADLTIFPFIVVGNKTDLGTREVSPEHVHQWCENLGAEYFECSAKEDIDVDMAFKSAARAALQYFKCSVMDNRENIQIMNREPEEQSNHSASKCTC